MKCGGRGNAMTRERWMRFVFLAGSIICGSSERLIASDDDSAAAAERGRIALTLGSFLAPEWKSSAYGATASFLGMAPSDAETKPEAFSAAYRARYGLHEAPYPNDGLPMGIRRGRGADGRKEGLQIDCMVCHGGSIGGQSYVGLGNTTLDLDTLLREMTLADGRRPPPRVFTLNSTRGTVNAGQIAAILLSLRNPDLSRSRIPIPLGANLPELDVPPWWRLAKKATIYYDGRTDARSVRTNMQFLLGEFTLEDFKRMEPTFRDIREYFKSIKPPKYPFAIDRERAEIGRLVFEKTCAKCHGTYGADGEYPNVIVELDKIGTDPKRALGLSDRLIAHYNSMWLGEEYPADTKMIGYQAPPLDGIWATAPFLHNGSVPTLDALLDSSKRPIRFRKPPVTDFQYYDQVNVGWKVETIDPSETDRDIPKDAPPTEARRIYDTRRFGLGNQGHLYGDGLSDADRRGLIEYLKTL